MKGLKKLFAAALLAVSSLPFVSCDPVAENLDNSLGDQWWEGTITQTTFYRDWSAYGQQYSSTRIEYIDLKFFYNSNTWSSGHGYEIAYDYYGHAVRRYFNFTVRDETYNNGYIYNTYIDMSYTDGSNEHMQIYVRNMTTNSFNGYIIDNGRDIGDCSFKRIQTERKYYNTNEYTIWKSSSTRSGADKTGENDSVKAEPKEKPVIFLN